ncbi:MAG TPA: hypothetical protein VE988_23760 [Gemmataceae bacterium]|nr:hypothetical protein [Gemmataceae bacterium]
MRTFIATLAVLGFLVIASTLFAAQEKTIAGPDKKAKPKFTIAKDTTYLTEPLDKGGYVDYVKGFNNLMSKGVTPDNNANVLLLKACGPQYDDVIIDVAIPAAYFKFLGIEPLPKDGAYFVSLMQHLKSKGKIGKDFKENELFDLSLRLCVEPWTAEKYPHVAAWLKDCDKPLSLVAEAVKRPRYYSPLVPEKSKDNVPGIIAPPRHGAQYCKLMARALLARAMLHLGEGRNDEAWLDLITCLRLGRLVAQGGDLIHHNAGRSTIDGSAAKAVEVFLDRTKDTSKQAMTRLNDLQKLPPLPPLADSIDLNRFQFIDSVLFVARSGADSLGQLDGKPVSNPVWESINWDLPLRNGNKIFDRMILALRTKDRQTRNKLLSEYNADMRKLSKSVFDHKDFVKAWAAAGANPEALGKVTGDKLVSLMQPAIVDLQQWNDRWEQVHLNLQVAFALAACRADTGKYPGQLDKLSPKYLAKIPEDLFTGTPLVYRPTGDGYLLYSFGINEKDDQGRDYDDEPRGDDIRIQMPLPSLKKS